MRLRPAVTLVLATSFSLAAFAGVKPQDLAVSKAEASAEAWLPLVDQSKYGESWDAASKYFKGALTRDKWTEQVKGVRAPFGALVSRKLNSAKYIEKLPGLPDGKYVIIQYDTSFESKKAAVETVTPMLDPDGTWRVSGYYIK
jgi:Protein of unknown function (DUF4019)